MVTAEVENAAPVTENFMIMPGINAPRSRAKFDLACKNPDFKKWVDDGDIYELTGDINELVSEHARAVIEMTAELDGLRHWKKLCRQTKIMKLLDTAIGNFEAMYREVRRPTG